ncbi:MAG: hypothetical protein JW776_16915 [Candidatus Lokiarchaeota archaeon]|nr:hypothetical protein [Candidatus Lokiarchaeota archaeon]
MFRSEAREKRKKEREEKRNAYEEKCWGGHSKTCPQCGAELVLREFRVRGFGGVIGETFFGMGLLGESAVLTEGNRTLEIHFVDCTNCDYQKRTHERFSGYSLSP